MSGCTDPSAEHSMMATETPGILSGAGDSLVPSKETKALTEKPVEVKKKFAEDNEFYSYFQDREEKFVVSDYCSRQPAVGASKRASLVNWLIENKALFGMCIGQIFQAVKLFDFILSSAKEPLRRHDRNALFIACAIVAAKFDDIENGFVVTDYECVRQWRIFDVKRVQKMEAVVLQSCRYDTRIPTAFNFLERHLNVAESDVLAFMLARYILELSLLFGCFIPVPESLKADAALALAMRIHGQPWDVFVKTQSSYNQDGIEEVMEGLNQMLRRRPKDLQKLQATQKRYSDEKYLNVASLGPLMSVLPLQAPVLVSPRYL
ncbi:hypothetical protein L596_022983 [Steinernema carpocapsae]|uniref:Cyclin C-terminal domain-containing protein n=1 Tax=Steinernema carpocapsae TaxID=34508 RepID=A0A4V5ZZF5_STECR|nr:hypothetical protein L596_022983 [Steinernema carpocapsae]